MTGHQTTGQPVEFPFSILAETSCIQVASMRGTQASEATLEQGTL